MPSDRRPLALPAMWPTCLAFLLLLAWGCDGGNKYVPPPPAKVKVAKPQKRQYQEYADFTGTTQAVDSVDLRARVEGFLLSANFKDGSLVKKGETLFIIDPKPFEAKVRSAEADLFSQQTNLERAETELTRANNLLSQKAGSQSDVIKWQTERNQAKASIQQAQAKLELARLDLEYTRLAAPFDGRIGRRQVDPGNLVGANEKTLLATVIRIDQLYVYFTIDERRLQQIMRHPKVQQGSPSRHILVEMGLSEDNGYPNQGRLDFMDLTVDAQTGTVLYRAVFPNSKTLIMPGMFTRIRIPLEVAEGVLVPETAVASGQTGHYVLLVNDQDVVEMRQVKLGASVDGQRVVASGLKGDERLITSGLQYARPGSKVAPEEASAPAGQAPAAAPANQAPKQP